MKLLILLTYRDVRCISKNRSNCDRTITIVSFVQSGPIYDQTQKINDNRIGVTHLKRST